jgi:glucosamine--fructose-6-phosphate aminotransferase (isomerizing)
MTTAFEEEIRSQSEVLRHRAKTGMAKAQEVANSWKDVMYVLVGARGSSDNAAIFFQYLAGEEVGLMVALSTPSLYRLGSRIKLDGAGVLLISQSGRSPGIADVLQRAKEQLRPTAVITNDVSSPLAMAGDIVLDMDAGMERAVASSKTLSATWHALAQLVEAIKGSTLEGLEELPEVVERVTEWSLAAELPMETLNATRGLTVVGRGIGFAVASEISIKIREVAGIRSEVYAASDFLHGPIGANGLESTLLLVVTDELPDEICNLIIAGCRDAGMKTVVLRSILRRHMECDAEIVLEEELPNWSLGLAMVIVGQVMALRLGEILHRPIDTSPGLNKVTVAI